MKRRNLRKAKKAEEEEKEEIGDMHALTDGRRVQTILVGDHTSTTESALCENFINTCEVDHSYRFCNLMVKVFHNKPSLFTPRENAEIIKIADILDVARSDWTSIKRTKKIEHAQLIAVSDFISFQKCISCDGRILPISSDEKYGRCTECSTAVLMETCPKVKSALLTIKSEDGAINLLGIDNQLSAITDLPLEEVTDIALLSAKEFEVRSIQHSNKTNRQNYEILNLLLVAVLSNVH